MCNPKPSPPNYKTKTNLMTATPNKNLDNINCSNLHNNNLLKPADDQLAQLHTFPTLSEVISY